MGSRSCQPQCATEVWIAELDVEFPLSIVSAWRLGLGLELLHSPCCPYVLFKYYSCQLSKWPAGVYHLGLLSSGYSAFSCVPLAPAGLLGTLAQTLPCQSRVTDEAFWNPPFHDLLQCLSFPCVPTPFPVFLPAAISTTACFLTPTVSEISGNMEVYTGGVWKYRSSSHLVPVSPDPCPLTLWHWYFLLGMWTLEDDSPRF